MKSIFSLLLSLYILLLAAPIQASLAELQQSGELQINAWLSPDEDTVKGQQIKLQIEVATTQQWRGGMTIDHVEMKDAIVLQREKFAINSVRREKGKSWLVQLWTLVIYPQSIGEYTVPAVSLNLALVDDDGYVTTGQITSPKIPFTVEKNIAFASSIEKSNKDSEGWIASPNFSIQDSFSELGAEVENLTAGDALSRTLVFSATDLAAMMLPTMPVEQITGIATYSQPAQLVDKVNRGDYLAERTEVHTYVIEKAGEYVIPEQVFYWWNSKDKTLETIVLPEYRLLVAGSYGHLIAWLFSLVIILLVAVLLFVKLKKAGKLRGHGQAIRSLLNSYFLDPRRELRKDFVRACKQGDEELALALLYQDLDRYGASYYGKGYSDKGDSDKGYHGIIRSLLTNLDQPELAQGLRQEFDALLQGIYQEDSAMENTTVKLFAEKLVQAMKKDGANKKGWFTGIDFKLN